MNLLESPKHDTVDLDGASHQLDAVHIFDAQSMLAVNAALMANRPLLIKGEPGTGKSQLARAAAQALGLHFESITLTTRTEVQDLFWRLDAVKRLAEAQLAGAVLRALGVDGKQVEASLGKTLKVERFVEPGPLWLAFDRQGALDVARQPGTKSDSTASPAPDVDSAASPAPDVDSAARPGPNAGSVVLLDEIDKADGSVPNGLLEALGNREFPGPGEVGPICQVVPPLVIITTNGEKTLPNAFMRRCLVLQLKLPEGDGALTKFLIKRGRSHFPKTPRKGAKQEFVPPSDHVLLKAATQLVDDRKACTTPPLPGQAEYLDLLRAVCKLSDDNQKRLGLITDVRPLVFGKYQDSACVTLDAQ